MTSDDIQVGKKYTREDWPNYVWLGSGKRKPGTHSNYMEFTEKPLVLIESPDSNIGLIFKTPEDSFGATEEDWELFKIIP